MCGITAIFAYGADADPVNAGELATITQRMFARGPDAGGTWISPDRRVGLGSRRLAIIDLTPEGEQPMFDVDRELIIVFNGEIYNHRELRATLARRGARFHSSSDTEVLLQMYRAHGERMVELLRGMFTFAIWDTRARRMFVARDPYGIKPLYIADDGRTVRIASQVKALLAGGEIPRTPDVAGIAGFHLLGSVPEPFTTFEAICAVEAGTSFFIDEHGRTERRRFYSIAEVFRRGRDQQTIANLTTPHTTLREFVSESIDYHLVSDVPIGVFLSAGIDSTALTALALPRASEPLRTITILFDVFRGRQFDEADDAASFARERGAPHTTRVVTRDEFVADLPKFFDAMDQPTVDGVNTWFVSKAAAEQRLKVALSGVGGDELFGSYPAFDDVPRIVRVASLAARIPLGSRALGGGLRVMKRVRKLSPKALAIAKLGTTYSGAYLLKRGLLLPDDLPKVMRADEAEEGLRRLALIDRIAAIIDPDPMTPFGRVAAFEASMYMRNQLLRDTDWTSMAHSLEVRTPLVDAYLLRQLAPTLLAYGAQCKAEFARAPQDPLPRNIAERPKTGFQAPLREWMRLAPDSTSTRMRSWAQVVLENYG
jgi:asparagine synthase (glutamine-hydrolysing)